MKRFDMIDIRTGELLGSYEAESESPELGVPLHPYRKLLSQCTQEELALSTPDPDQDPGIPSVIIPRQYRVEITELPADPAPVEG